MTPPEHVKVVCKLTVQKNTGSQAQHDQGRLELLSSCIEHLGPIISLLWEALENMSCDAGDHIWCEVLGVWTHHLHLDSSLRSLGLDLHIIRKLFKFLSKVIETQKNMCFC